MGNLNNDDIFGPRKVKFVDILMSTAGAFISGVIGSVLLLLIVTLFTGIIDIPESFKNANTVGFGGSSPIFPIVLSFITFFISIIVLAITYFFLTVTDGEKYKRTIIHFGQISFFSIIIYIIFAPVYIYVGMNSYSDILFVFIVHILLLTFGEMMILELLNNYRYILLGFYSCFFGLGLTGVLTILIFSFFPEGYAKLLSLLLILPLINGFLIFFKGLFELIYYTYFMISGKDQLGDIFEQIKQEEIENYNQAVIENNTY